MGGKLHRRALEHVRPVCSSEARQISDSEVPLTDTPKGNITPEIPHEEISNNQNQPNNPHNNHQDNPDNDDNSQSQDQPDNEPEGENAESTPNDDFFNNPVDTPIPENSPDEDLVTTHLVCVEDEVLEVNPIETPCAWRCEFEVPGYLSEKDLNRPPPASLLIATTEKKQRTEVKLHFDERRTSCLPQSQRK